MSALATLPLAELAIALPLAAALLALVAANRASSFILAVGPVVFALAGLLGLSIQTNGVIERQVGGWAAPLGIVLQADGLAGAFIMTTAIIMWVAGLYARRSATLSPPNRTAAFTFWPLFFIMWASLNTIFLSRDLFNLYVGLEMLTLTAVAMVAFGSIRAAARYLHFALLGSLAYLTGVVLIYAAAGTLDMSLISQGDGARPVMAIAGAILTAGLIIKTALFPFHAWLPPAHGNAPPAASALLSALIVKASFYILVRFWFDAAPEVGNLEVMNVLGVMGAGAVLYGSLLAIRQERLKLIIAYSTVAQIGYLFFIFPLAADAGDPMPWTAGAWTGGIFHALAHAFAKAALFLCAGIIIEACGHDRLSDMGGIVRALPMTIAAFALAAISIMGLPPSGGFMAKYLMLTSAMASGQIFYAGVMLVGGLLSAIYLFRPLNAAFSGKDVPDIAPVPRKRQMLPLILALFATILGVASALPYEFLQIGRPGEAAEGIE
jgi:formate hydrogenlyase subunit 3/multisubunit Na+/H+ antiporter MnhD subunit